MPMAGKQEAPSNEARRAGPSAADHYVAARAGRGFGTVVMQEMVEPSGDGAVDLDYAPSGLTWRLSCPAAIALERSRA
jgi:hypothetical protein